MRMLIETTVFALALSLVACGGDQGGKADKGDKTAAKGDAGDKAGADKGEVAAADDGAGADEAPALDPKVEKAVTIANKISADPGSTDAILGDFLGLAEGSTVEQSFAGNVYSFSITYAGGDGNDACLAPCQHHAGRQRRHRHGRRQHRLQHDGNPWPHHQCHHGQERTNPHAGRNRHRRGQWRHRRTGGRRPLIRVCLFSHKVKIHYR